MIYHVTQNEWVALHKLCSLDQLLVLHAVEKTAILVSLGAPPESSDCRMLKKFSLIVHGRMVTKNAFH